MELFLTLLVVLLVARLFGEVAGRLGQAPLVGELVGGTLLGLVVRRFPESLPLLSERGEGGVFGAFTSLGMFLLMLLAGLRLRPRELAEVSAGAFVVALSGMLAPFVLGFGLAWWFLPESPARVAQAMFVGTSLAVTAIPAAVRVLMDLRQLHTLAGRVIVSAAIIDDVISLLLLALLTAMIRTGELPAASELLMLSGRALLFFATMALLARFASPLIARLVQRPGAEGSPFSVLLAFGLAAAVFAEYLHLHFVVGAFIAGLFFSRATVGEGMHEQLASKLTGVTSGFLAPIFFASIGLHLDLGAVTAIPGFLALYLFIAFASKLAGAGLPAYLLGMSRRDALVIGTGMSARGAVELIIAEVALRAGLFAVPEPPPPIVANMFSAVVLMAIVTTLVAPVALRYLLSMSAGGGLEEEEP